ncbi:MAG: N-acetylneuraminate synthase family protein [Nitrosopumilus sp.]|nr:N-acetylneuraminate synthase family protein [Nitrosopumilus sp.]
MKTFVVAEIASNWEGDIIKAEKLIKNSKKAGADAVKFQMWRATDLYSEKYPEWKFIKKSEVTFKKAEKFKKIADKEGIEFFCSAFYPEAIPFLETLNVKRYKIASRTCLLKDPNSKETLLQKSITKKPVFISMGMGGNKKYLEKIFAKNKVTFCYCISKYPTDIKKINWEQAKKFDGFSDHTLGITAPILFTILKKQSGSKQIMIEKHVKLKESKGPDASTSIDTDELSQLVSHIRIIEKLKI